MVLFWCLVAAILLNLALGVSSIVYGLYATNAIFGFTPFIISVCLVLAVIIFLVITVLIAAGRIKEGIDAIKNMSTKDIIKLVIKLITKKK